MPEALPPPARYNVFKSSPRHGRRPVDTNVLWGVVLALAVLGVLGAWFYWCGHADEVRQLQTFARSTLLYAGAGFVVGLAFLTSDIGTAPPEGRLGILAVTVCCFLLVYSAGSAWVASNDQSTRLVNLTGRALLFSDPELAPFYTLPAPQEEPASELPPVRPRTYYVVSSELGRLGSQAGRTDLYIVDPGTNAAADDTGPLRVRRLLPAVTAAGAADSPRNGLPT
jgi:hypothetical protein